MTPTRDLAPDVLRGFALLGIVLVNVAYFATDPLLGATGEWLRGTGNTVAAFLVWTLAQGKFYLLFSFLFGYASQYLVKGDPANRSRWIARALALLVFGALHVVLLWHGDILFGYGLLALPFAALMFRRDATLWRWAWGTYLAFAALQALLVAGLWLAERAGEPLDAMGGPPALVDVLRDGTYLASIPARLEVWAATFPSGMLLQGGYAFAMFLLGLVAARAKALRVGGPLAPRRLMAWGFGLGLPIQALTAWAAIANELGGATSETLAVGAIALNLTTAPLLSAGYVGAILHLLERRPAWIAWMRYPGQMSLTTYLLQSAVLATVFGPWGLGLFQRLDYWAAVLVAAATHVVLAGLAWVVLKRFRQGPLEWVMSSWTKRWSRGWVRGEQAG
ncbi:MAG: DUF418 domain-containing protein [Trueperaceae bacterium]